MFNKFNAKTSSGSSSLSLCSYCQSSNVDLFNLKEILFSTRILGLPPQLLDGIPSDSIFKRTNNNGTEKKTKKVTRKKYVPS